MKPAAPILALIILLLSSAGLDAQRYRFREYRQENGLGNLAVTAMLQDSDKYLWVGTQNGLFRYDGARFRHYGKDDGLPGAYILALVEAPDGTLWISTHLGVARMVAGKIIAEHIHRTAADTTGMGMAIAADGTLYVSAPGGLIVGRRTGRSLTYAFELAYVPAALKSKTILQIATDAQSRAWFGCGGGLCVLSPNGKLEFHQEDLGIAKDRWDGAVFDTSGNFWLRSNSRLVKLAKGGDRFAGAPVAPKSFDLSLLMVDRRGDLFAPAQDGVWMRACDTGQWRRVGPENGLNGEAITSILRDHEDNLWFGFLGDGLVRWMGAGDWEGWTKQEGLNSNTVWAILRDRNRVVWAGTDNGLAYLDGKAGLWRSVTGRRDTNIGRVMSLSPGDGQYIWASSELMGLLRIDSAARTYEVIGFPPGGSIPKLQSVFLDSRKTLWLATANGLYRAEVSAPLRWTYALRSTNYGDETIYTVTEDSRGVIWAAGNFGVIRIEGGKAARIDSSNGLMSNATWFAREVEAGQVWIGYLDGVGRTRVDSGESPLRFTHSRLDEGSSPNMYYFVGKDRSGLLWFGTDQGVYVTGAGSVVHLTDQDGLFWNDCNSNAFYADPDGSVWIGTARGLVHGRFRVPLMPPAAQLKVNSIVVNGREADFSKPVEMAAGRNSIELTVSPLTFRYDSRLNYQYRLGPAGANWSLRQSPVIAFNDVPGGKSSLQARMKIDRYPWSETLIDVPVEVAIPFWNGMLGRALAALLSLGLLALIWRYRNHKLLAEKSMLSGAVAARTEEIERLLTEAREGSRLKSEFLANMSHEIRTPMNGLLGMLQLLRGTRLESEQRGYVDLAKDSAEGLLSLLNEILDLSKVESGHLEIERQPFALDHCVQRVVGLLGAAAQNKGLRLTRSIDSAIAPVLIGDELRLQQVLLNLLGNAIKFTESGFVNLSIAPAPAAPDAVHFSVEDSGIGIAAGKLDLIFEAFRQADGSTTRRFGGTGLGLAISRNLVELLGGKLEVESTEGKGSRFFFTVPLPAGDEQVSLATPVPPVRQAARGRYRILLAEDNRINQLVVMKLLEREGHVVELAQDGAQAVEAALGGDFDLILMDVHMPVLDGIQATERIREAQLRAGKYTPIFALTAGVLSEERERCLAAGMDQFLAKPIREEDLREAIGRLGPSPSRE